MFLTRGRLKVFKEAAGIPELADDQLLQLVEGWGPYACMSSRHTFHTRVMHGSVGLQVASGGEAVSEAEPGAAANGNRWEEAASNGAVEQWLHLGSHDKQPEGQQQRCHAHVASRLAPPNTQSGIGPVDELYRGLYPFSLGGS